MRLLKRCGWVEIGDGRARGLEIDVSGCRGRSDRSGGRGGNWVGTTRTVSWRSDPARGSGRLSRWRGRGVVCRIGVGSTMEGGSGLNRGGSGTRTLCRAFAVWMCTKVKGQWHFQTVGMELEWII